MTDFEKLGQLKADLKAYEEILERMPESTVLGRLCIEGYIRSTKRKIEKLIKIIG